MLTFPGLQDRMIVLAAGLVIAAGLAFLINRLRLRADAGLEERSRGHTED